MDGRGQYQTEIGNKHHPAENGITGREPFAGFSFNIYDRSHTTQNHGRLMQEIEPGTPFHIMIPVIPMIRHTIITRIARKCFLAPG